MKEIIQEYGGSILVFVVIIALIAVMVWLLSTNGENGGVVAQAFQQLMDTFFNGAKEAGGITGGK